jgi:hypothetical protein
MVKVSVEYEINVGDKFRISPSYGYAGITPGVVEVVDITDYQELVTVDSAVMEFTNNFPNSIYEKWVLYAYENPEGEEDEGLLPIPLDMFVKHISSLEGNNKPDVAMKKDNIVQLYTIFKLPNNENLDNGTIINNFREFLESSLRNSDISIGETSVYPFEGEFRADYLDLFRDAEVYLSDHMPGLTDKQLAMVASLAAEELSEEAGDRNDKILQKAEMLFPDRVGENDEVEKEELSIIKMILQTVRYPSLQINRIEGFKEISEGYKLEVVWMDGYIADEFVTYGEFEFYKKHFNN